MNKEMKTTGTWRLPTIEELLTLVDHTKTNPASSDQEMKPYYYWSSTTDASHTSVAWGVGFNKGFDYWNAKANSGYVRCVRDTPNGLEWSKTASIEMTWDAAMDYAENLNKEITEQEKHTMKLEDLKPGDKFQDSDITTDAIFLDKSPCPIKIEIIGDHKYSLCNQKDTLVVAKDAGNGNGVVINTVTY